MMMTGIERTDASLRPGVHHRREYALQACDRCRLSKRKCDKLLPHCSRCLRLRAECIFPSKPFTPESHTSDIADDSPTLEIGAFTPLKDIPPWKILSLISIDAKCGDEIGWAETIRGYFEHIHYWFAVFRCASFEERLSRLTRESKALPSPEPDTPAAKALSIYRTLTGLNSVAKPEISRAFALLILTMYLTTRSRLTKSGERLLFDDLYWFVKRAVTSSLADEPQLESIQAGALVALYEYGHGEPIDAYATLSKAVAAAKALDIKPAQFDGTPDGMRFLSSVEEERNGLWWALFVLDQFLHIDEAAKPLPFLLNTPESHTLLPGAVICFPPLNDPRKFREGFGNALSIDAPLSTQEMDSFQMSAKVATLLHQALEHEHTLRARPGFLPPVESFASLDAEIREATMVLLQNDVRNWQVTLDCFSMTVSALFSLYLPYLPMLETKTAAEIKGDTGLTTALTALGFASQLAVDISCKVSNDLENSDGSGESPDLDRLVAPAAPTCYLAIKTCTSLRKIFPEEWPRFEKAIVDRLGSLRFFNHRWGIADRVMRQIQELDGLDPFELLSYNSPSVPQ